MSRDDQMIAFLRRRHPTADDEELMERLEQMKLAIRWRHEQVVHLTCSVCGESKPTSAFYADTTRASGFYPQCRNCKE